VLQRRLLLCLYGLGTNAGLKRMAASNREVGYADLLYVRRRFIDNAGLREAIRRVVDATPLVSATSGEKGPPRVPPTARSSVPGTRTS